MRANDLAFSALLCALTAILAQIQLPLTPVPVSLALLGVYLSALTLPPRAALMAMGAYVILGAAGVPVYAGFAAGPGVLTGPTGGFLLGYAACAPVISLLKRRSVIAALLAGTGICYALGALWFMAVTGSPLYTCLISCVLPFLPGDALKALLAAALSRRLKAPLQRMRRS